MSEKILIIEDDDSLATLTRLQLESKGYLVQIAHNGRAEGLRQAYSWQPDLVLLDIMMPDMDGWTVCQRLREMNDVPIIFVTAVGQERNIVRGLQLGADDYIIKPFSTKELQARIEAVLRRHRQTDNADQPLHYITGWLTVDSELVLNFQHGSTFSDGVQPLQSSLCSEGAQNGGFHMKSRVAGLLSGRFFLALCGPLAAHPSGGGYGYPADGSACVTIWGASYGSGGWTGSLSFGSPYAYAPAYIPWAALPAGHRHVAQCNHGPRHGYASAWRQGYLHGRHDGYSGHGKHGRGLGRGHGHDD